VKVRKSSINNNLRGLDRRFDACAADNNNAAALGEPDKKHVAISTPCWGLVVCIIINIIAPPENIKDKMRAALFACECELFKAAFDL